MSRQTPLTTDAVDGVTVIFAAWCNTVAAKLNDTGFMTDYDAVGDGVTDDTAAVNAALATGKLIDGLNKTYAVTGNILLPASTYLRNAKFKQLTPNDATRRTLYQTGGTLCVLERVSVNRNGDGSGGGLDTSAGIYVNANTGYVCIRECEVYGNDFGMGICVVDSNDATIDRCYVHDMTGGTSASSVLTDDSVQGIKIIRGQRTHILSPVIKTLLNRWVAQTAFNRFTRGISVGGCVNFSIVNPRIDNVDQGIDISGDENPKYFSIIGGNVTNCYSWGYKCANTVEEGSFEGCVAQRCGLGGFAASAPNSVLTPQTRRIDYIGCRALETGYGGIWTASANVCGFRTESTVQYPDYPRGIRWIGCHADAAGAVMEYGFFNDVTLGAAGDEWNEAINCSVHGATITAYYGLNQGFCERDRTTDFSIPNDAWTDLQWNSTAADRMLATSGTNTQLIASRTGVYLVTVGVEWAANATGLRGLRLQVGGTTEKGAVSRISAVDTGSKNLCVSTIVSLAQGALVTAQAYQNSGGALNVLAGTASIRIGLLSSGMS